MRFGSLFPTHTKSKVMLQTGFTYSISFCESHGPWRRRSVRRSIVSACEHPDKSSLKTEGIYIYIYLILIDKTNIIIEYIIPRGFDPGESFVNAGGVWWLQMINSAQEEFTIGPIDRRQAIVEHNFIARVLESKWSCRRC